jgi:DNA-binding transcriptional LysR family regulator
VRPRIDLNLLPIVVALYERRSVSRAAESLHMSQPAVSAALGKLRTALGDPLFVRTSRGMEPTPRAAALIAPAREALAKIDQDVLSAAAFDPATTTRVFTFALSDVGEMVFLPKLLERLTRLAPNAAVRSVTLPMSQIEQGLESGEIDLALGYFPDLRPSSFFQQRLFTHTFACLLRADHPIRGERLSLEQFLALGHAVVRVESRAQEVFENFLRRRRIRRRIVLRTPHFMSIPMIVARSDLLVTVPHALAIYFARLSTNLKIVRLDLDMPRIDLKQHWHRRFHHDPCNKWLRALAAELFNDETDEWRLPPDERRVMRRGERPR